jgi:hypothetical protein
MCKDPECCCYDEDSYIEIDRLRAELAEGKAQRDRLVAAAHAAVPVLRSGYFDATAGNVEEALAAIGEKNG